MKINEVVNEGLFDKLKQGASAVKSGAQKLQRGVQAGVQGYQAARNTRQNQQQAAAFNNTVTKNVQGAWSQYAQNLQSAGTQPRSADLVKWYSSFAGTKPTVDPRGPASLDPLAVNQWISKNVAGYIAQKGAMAPPPAAGKTANTLKRMGQGFAAGVTGTPRSADTPAADPAAEIPQGSETPAAGITDTEVKITKKVLNNLKQKYPNWTEQQILDYIKQAGY